MPRYLFGPVTAAFAEDNLSRPRQAGSCLTFDAAAGADLTFGPAENWEAVCERLPRDWQPDFIALYLPYTGIPACLWAAPVPVVGLGADWNLLWHWYRHCLPRCDLVLTDVAGVEAMRAEGMEHGRVANLFGLAESLAEHKDQRSEVRGQGSEEERDIDILFVGNLHSAVQSERLGWLGRLARLSGHRRVLIKQGLFGAEYRKLLSRARIVFNRSIRGECNKRVFEAATVGALLFQERGNREIQEYFQDRKECVLYDEDNLEALLEYYLDHEEERRCIAEAARRRVREFTFERLWQKHLRLIEAEWEGMAERCRARCSPSPRPSPQRGEGELVGRVWAALCGEAGRDANLTQDLAHALLAEPHKADSHYALGIAAALERRREPAPAMAQAAAGYFQRAVACDPGHLLAGLSLALALDLCGQRQAAIEHAQQTLQRLEWQATLPLSGFDAGLFPFGFDVFRVEWERCAWQHAGRPAREAAAKSRLLRWRLHALLAESTHDVAHAYEAALARPDLPAGQALLGEALAAVKRPAEAVPHLRQALAGNPFDLPTSRLLFQALGDAGDGLGQRRLAEERRLVGKAAPEAVAAEPWIVQTPPAGDELASIIILCCNELAYTRQCLESVVRHTRWPYELILVDNGSTDGTAEYLQP